MISYAAIAPHPPLLIPQIGGQNIKEVESTVNSMETIAQDLVKISPDTIVFITPHGNVFSDCVSCLTDPILEGNLAQFGAADIKTSHKNDIALIREIGENALAEGVNVIGIDQDLARGKSLKSKLDHGIMVPLHYVEQAGLKEVAITAMTLGYLPLMDLYTIGSAIKKSAEKLNRKIAVIASGDLSHRLKDSGPYDYHPDGKQFDMTLKKHIENQDIQSILTMPEELVNNAGECGYRSLIIMLGALDGSEYDSRVLSYEGPFGVGYLTASFIPKKESHSLLENLKQEYKEQIKEQRESESMCVKWARTVLENYIKNGDKAKLPEEWKDLEKENKAVFVSLKKHQQLRGCIGTIVPIQDNLAEEIANNAIGAGINDPRFFPVEENELNDLVYSVDVLTDSEPCEKNQLDPKKYGVIVTQGNKRGLLLPDLEGIDTVEQQLSIALEKAGIAPDSDYKIERFEVKRYT
ncbi:putative ACR [Candidatus Syntrophocurvum alkaliphilum]|uniref:Putative ACR n=1 Tax=Candidatus Syntrophocurvum alkaliphilum TaxID=2293317 RepID=A0A6I6DE37_9FIRM|nr:AmmeMemoRadiSam system protein A [Candidatus Syntrophocurvum alkaliphilum]QGU00815.1 putative ACR [Candidatus Syntrophocurvum alkaliphilum]